MPNLEHVAIAKSGTERWNAWRQSDPKARTPDLSGAVLREIHLPESLLYGVDFTGTDLTGAWLQSAEMISAKLDGATLTSAAMNGIHAPETSFRRATLIQTQLRLAKLSCADFTEANLSEARLGTADLAGADFTRATLRSASFSDSECRLAHFSQADAAGAIFHQAFLRSADFTNANLRAADLSHAVLDHAVFTGADLTGCRVHGAAAWNVQLEGAIQKDLIITPEDITGSFPDITVDRLEVAQFAYLLLNNANLRQIIDTVVAKCVLILGRFTPERKVVLDLLRDELRKRNFVPVVFDFVGPTSQDLTETIKTLVSLSRFVIADVTNPSSSPLELQATVSDFMIPFVPILQKGEPCFAMFANLQNKYDWVMDVLTYDSPQTIVRALDWIIGTALRKHAKLIARKGRQIRMHDNE